MTTNPQEGERQVEALRPKLKVGDTVRLTGGMQRMTVVALEDYDNMVVCEWKVTDSFPARSLVKIEKPATD